MSRRVTFGTLIVFAFLLLSFAACPRTFPASAAESAITVSGNRHIDAEMIRSHFHADTDGHFDATALDVALKSLYATGLFQDVTVSRDGDHVLVKVVENATIERMAFEGNKKIKEEAPKKAMQSKAGGPLARAVVHDDAERIIELYRQRGYFAVRGSIRRRSAPGTSASIWCSRSRRATSSPCGRSCSSATAHTRQTSSKA